MRLSSLLLRERTPRAVARPAAPSVGAAGSLTPPVTGWTQASPNRAGFRAEAGRPGFLAVENDLDSVRCTVSALMPVRGRGDAWHSRLPEGLEQVDARVVRGDTPRHVRVQDDQSRWLWLRPGRHAISGRASQARSGLLSGFSITLPLRPRDSCTHWAHRRDSTGVSSVRWRHCPPRGPRRTEFRCRPTQGRDAHLTVVLMRCQVCCVAGQLA